jgi:hypothetical protein
VHLAIRGRVCEPTAAALTVLIADVVTTKPPDSS